MMYINAYMHTQKFCLAACILCVCNAHMRKDAYMKRIHVRMYTCT